MTNLIETFFSNPFLKMALLGGLAASVTSGILGCFVVIKRIVFIAGSIAHSVLGGLGLCLWLKYSYGWQWLHPMYGAIVAALLSAVIIGIVHLRFKEREDTIIAAIWSTGMSVGVIFVALTPGYAVDLMNYLFGNLLWVSKGDVLMLCILAFIVIATTFFFHRQFLAICFDPKQALLQGVPLTRFYLVLLCLIALAVVLLIQVVGAILVIAMLAIAPAIAGNFTHKLSTMMALSVGISFILTIGGLFLSYELNWPPGATIALFAAASYLVSFSKKKLS